MTNLNALREAIAESPDNVPLLLLHAHSCMEELSLGEARSGFEKVLRLLPDNAEAKLGIARLLFLDGRTSEAVVRVQSLIEESPGFAPAHLFLSRLYLGEEDHEGALKHYRKATAVNKSMTDPALERALSGATRDRRRSRGAGDQASAATTRRDAEGDDGNGERRSPEEDQDEEILSFFDELDGDEEGDGISIGFSMEDFVRPSGRFDLIGGLEDIKEELRMRIVHPLERPELFRVYGKGVGGSLLLYGPPGCGKTLVCRSLANETPARFFEVGLPHVLEMYVGEGERDLHQIFQLARKHAPSVVFIDDLDSLAAGGATGKVAAEWNLMQQLLEEMDRESASPSGILVVGVSSAPWNLGDAVSRPGRFERRILVPLPDRSTRKAIFAILAKDKPIIDLDLNYLASKTEGYSGAELKAIFDMATDEALALAVKEDRIVPLTMAMCMQCARRLRPAAYQWVRKFREANAGRD